MIWFIHLSAILNLTMCLNYLLLHTYYWFEWESKHLEKYSVGMSQGLDRTEWVQNETAWIYGNNT